MVFGMHLRDVSGLSMSEESIDWLIYVSLRIGHSDIVEILQVERVIPMTSDD